MWQGVGERVLRLGERHVSGTWIPAYPGFMLARECRIDGRARSWRQLRLRSIAMAIVGTIRSEKDYEVVLARIDELMDAALDTQEDDELESLVGMVMRYEELHYPLGPPDAAAAIEFRMDQAG